jgi:hypothetical protein
MNIDVPFHIEDNQRTATATLHDHAGDVIEQLVFTSPGERVNPVPPSGRVFGSSSSHRTASSSPRRCRSWSRGRFSSTSRI